MKPFSQKPLREQNRLQKLMKVLPPENFPVQVNNLLEERTIGQVTKVDIDLLANKYKIKVPIKNCKELEELYSDFLRYSFASQENIDSATFAIHLAELLYIDPKRASNIRTEIGRVLYKRKFENLIENGILSEDDENELEHYCQYLRLPEQVEQEVSNEVRINRIQKEFDKISSDGELSPEEEERFNRISNSLKVTVGFEKATTDKIEKMRKIWSINHDELQRIEPDIMLPKKESCYFIQNVKWYEYRKQRIRANYGGVAGRIKIAKGLYYRYGSLNINPQSTDSLTLIDEGKLYLTSKKILFVGTKKNVNIALTKIIDIEAFSDGVDVVKDSGKSPFLGFTENIEIFVATLTRLITESN